MGGGEPVGDAQEVRIQHVVRVGEGDPLARRVLEPAVARRTLAGVGLGEHVDAVAACAGPRTQGVKRAVGRPVVDRDDLEIAAADPQALDGPHVVREVRLDVVDRADDREPRARGHAGRKRSTKRSLAWPSHASMWRATNALHAAASTDARTIAAGSSAALVMCSPIMSVRMST